MRKKVVLSCAVCNSRNYSSMKNSSLTERMEIKKFCKACNEHTTHKETK